jgi:hypothetical protein
MDSGCGRELLPRPIYFICILDRPHVFGLTRELAIKSNGHMVRFIVGEGFESSPLASGGTSCLTQVSFRLAE